MLPTRLNNVSMTGNDAVKVPPRDDFGVLRHDSAKVVPRSEISSRAPAGHEKDKRRAHGLSFAARYQRNRLWRPAPGFMPWVTKGIDTFEDDLEY